MFDTKKSYILYFVACFVAIIGGIVLLSSGTTNEQDGTQQDRPVSERSPTFKDPDSQILERFVTVDGTRRRFKIFVPGIYFRENVEVPLVFAFHGFTNTPEIAQADYQLDEVSETENFINVYPAGILDNWEVFSLGSTRDLDFVVAMVDFMKAEFKIKESSIYSTGYSHGGFFTTIIACQLTDIFAAIAPIAGTFYIPVLPACSPSRPIPYLQIHGTNDFVIPYNGNRRTVSVEEALEFWADVNGQSQTPVIIEDDMRDVDKYIFQPNRVVQHYRANGVGHSPIASFSSAKIIEFFKEVTDF